jgi:hypothetical protein
MTRSAHRGRSLGRRICRQTVLMTKPPCCKSFAPTACPSVSVDVILVLWPHPRIRDDILPDLVERFLVSDHVLVVVALPQAGAGRLVDPVGPSSGYRLERLDDRGERSWPGSFRTISRRGDCRGEGMGSTRLGGGVAASIPFLRPRLFSDDDDPVQMVTK